MSVKPVCAVLVGLLLTAGWGRAADNQAGNFNQAPATGGVCHDYVLDRLGQPDRGGRTSRAPGDVNATLSALNYTPGKPADKLPPGTVIQWGGAHVGIVGPDGRIHHYTQAAPTLGIPASVNVNNSIADVSNVTRTWQDGNGNTMQNQPYRNTPVSVWIPPTASGDPNAPYRANANPQANEPAGGVRVTPGDYGTSTPDGQSPGMTTNLPDWIKNSSAGSGNTTSGGQTPSGPMVPPMTGPGWSGPGGMTGPMIPPIPVLPPGGGGGHGGGGSSGGSCPPGKGNCK